MGEEANQHQVFVNLDLEKTIIPSDDQAQLGRWDSSMEGDVIGASESLSDESCTEDSVKSVGSISSSDLVEDASSSPSTMSPHTDGPLYELSELMAQLPIKSGLSKFYQGKSQSYTSLASVKSFEDLAKKVPSPSRSFKMMKTCKSYAGLDGHNKSYGPKATIAKRGSRGSSCLSSLGRRGSFVGTVGLSYP